MAVSCALVRQLLVVVGGGGGLAAGSMVRRTRALAEELGHVTCPGARARVLSSRLARKGPGGPSLSATKWLRGYCTTRI